MKATHFHAGRRLSEGELGPPLDACPVCLAVGGRRPLLRIQTDPPVDLLGCSRCGGASASRMPTPAVLEAFYADYYSGRDERVTCGSSARFARAIARRVEPREARERLRVLDFGGGDGGVAIAVAERLLARGRIPGAEIRLVDFAKPRAPGDPRIEIRGARELDETEGRFDLVLASAVLEHVPEMHAAARRLFDRVAPGGVFYARTPWLAPIARVFPKLDLTFPAHVHDLGAGFWDRVVETFALDATLVRSAPSPVEDSFAERPARALAAAILKLPARLESALGSRDGRRLWTWTGGWEAILRFR